MTLGLFGGLKWLIALFGGVIALLCFVFWFWMLIDCLTNNAIQNAEKVVWVMVIVLLPFIGPLIYLFVGRPRRKLAT